LKRLASSSQGKNKLANDLFNYEMPERTHATTTHEATAKRIWFDFSLNNIWLLAERLQQPLQQQPLQQQPLQQQPLQ
jgi:hypothetical protein